ncbi:hypothetical protein CEXT_629251 [Caerostris extrusa]|uniref:Uncharacterized protein n=1 Tax=Caerostris extrusa TaxID=172846 RepID=A0AAV4NEM3_CAEEX|nr:hypothetical protein CEXT_629251 [Caerostris extrusa]
MRMMPFYDDNDDDLLNQIQTIIVIAGHLDITSSFIVVIITIFDKNPRIIIWEVRTFLTTPTKVVDRHSYSKGGIMIWAGNSSGSYIEILLDSHIDMNVLHGGPASAVKCRNEILRSDSILLLWAKNSS